MAKPRFPRPAAPPPLATAPLPRAVAALLDGGPQPAPPAPPAPGLCHRPPATLAALYSAAPRYAALKDARP